MPTPVQYPTLNYQEAALLAGEKTEPRWKSPNELIHERINFDDTIWGFGLVGGAHYRTTLKVTYVKKGSRAQKAHIFPGDIVLKINGVDSTQVTLEEAHQMILDAGIHLVINVTSPEDEEDSYYYYQDPLIDEVNEEEEKEKEKAKAKKVPKPYSKCSHWALQWPWKCKRKIIWKESNCYLVPSKFVEKHGDRLLPEVKQGDIVLDSIHNVKKTNSTEAEEVSNNAINETERDNEETKSTGDVDNNEIIKDGEETDAYFDKFESDLPGMSQSDEVVTNGR